MDRRTRKILAQILQEREQGTPAATARLKPARAALLERHLDVWDRLGAVRRPDVDPGDMASGRDRMLSALSEASTRRRAPLSLFAPLVRSAAIVIGLLVLTGAAAGASAALGGPHIWRTVGVNRGSERAMEASESGDTTPTGDDTGSGPASGDAIAEAEASADGETSGGGDDQGADYVPDDASEEYNDNVTSGAPTSGDPEETGPGHGAGAASSATDDEPEEEDGEEEDDTDDDKRSASPKLNLTPTPNLQGSGNMAYHGAGSGDADEKDGDDAGQVEVQDGTDGGHEDGNDAKSGPPEVHPGRGPSTAAENQEKPKGQGHK